MKVIFGVVDETGEIAGGRLTDRISVGVLTRVVPRDLVNEVLAETRRREKRSRLLRPRRGVFRHGDGDLPGWL